MSLPHASPGSTGSTSPLSPAAAESDKRGSQKQIQLAGSLASKYQPLLQLDLAETSPLQVYHSNPRCMREASIHQRDLDMLPYLPLPEEQECVLPAEVFDRQGRVGSRLQHRQSTQKQGPAEAVREGAHLLSSQTCTVYGLRKRLLSA